VLAHKDDCDGAYEVNLMAEKKTFNTGTYNFPYSLKLPEHEPTRCEQLIIANFLSNQDNAPEPSPQQFYGRVAHCNSLVIPFNPFNWRRNLIALYIEVRPSTASNVIEMAIYVDNRSAVDLKTVRVELLQDFTLRE